MGTQFFDGAGGSFPMHCKMLGSITVSTYPGPQHRIMITRIALDVSDVHRRANICAELVPLCFVLAIIMAMTLAHTTRRMDIFRYFTTDDTMWRVLVASHHAAGYLTA